MDKNVESVCARLRERSEVGIRKYGVTTERGDLSRADWLRHLQEELMDAAVYIEAALAAQPAEQPAVPSGFVPVPVEPTEAMWEAGIQASIEAEEVYGENSNAAWPKFGPRKNRVRHVFSAMLAAATKGKANG